MVLYQYKSLLQCIEVNLNYYTAYVKNHALGGFIRQTSPDRPPDSPHFSSISKC